MRVFLFYSFILINFVSCSKTCEKKSTKISTDSKLNEKAFIEELELDTTNEKTSYISFKTERDLLNISDSSLTDAIFEMRLWNLGMWQNTYLLNIRYDSTKWTAKEIEFEFISKKILKAKFINPKVGWSNFQDSICTYNPKNLKRIDHLKEQIKLKIQPIDIIDGGAVYIEIITPSFYKIVSCREPESFKEKLRESKNFVSFYEFYSFINRNFDNILKRKHAR